MRPLVGGGGMVMKVEPIDRALNAIITDRNDVLIVLLTPQGEISTRKTADELAARSRIVLDLWAL